MGYLFNYVFQLLASYRYLVLFPLVVIEGPVITIISGFLSSLGFLNLFLAFVVIVIADLVGDTIYYMIGRFGGRSSIKRWGHYLAVDDDDINKLDEKFSKNVGRTLFTGKITHLVGSIVLVTAGVVKVPYRKFILFNFLATIPKSFFLIIVGFYFGQVAISLSRYLNDATIVATILVLVSLVVYLLIRRRILNNRRKSKS